MYAIVKSGGKQYKVKAGDIIRIERVPNRVGDEIVFDKVLLKAGNSDEGAKSALVIGDPFIEGATVKGRVLEQGRDKKIKILKFRRRKHSMKGMGHRQAYSEIEIESIS
tara:strand:- start:3986 stop:4312 length:327 start_codon:yes stop_codon:yes gene_type:complete